MNLLKDSNDIIKEGVLHILAKAGGAIREQLAVTSRCPCKIFGLFKSITLYNFLNVCLYAVL